MRPYPMHWRARFRAGALVRRFRPAPPAAEDEQRLRELLHLAANTVHPRPGLDAIQMRTRGAPVVETGAPRPTAVKEPTSMKTIIPRHAKDLHAGDVITHDPDHDQPVRWKVTRPAVRTRDGEYALADYVDQDTGKHGIGYWRVLTDLKVEPAGGAE